MAVEKKFFKRTPEHRIMVKGVRTRRKIYGNWIYKWRGQVSTHDGKVLWRGAFHTRPTFVKVLRAFNEEN